MEQLHCGFLDCDTKLETADEIVMGLCGRHMEDISSDQYFVGVCWQCGSITLIQSRYDQRQFPMKEKYLFARGCAKCTGDPHESFMWMTINRKSSPASAVTPTGKIVKLDNIEKQESNTVEGETNTNGESPSLSN
jgi:hypothetical protein